jgi:geranyl-CoA carboxylase alpha subunit
MSLRDNTNSIVTVELRKPNFMNKIQKILIANRGEIAVRVIRTARNMGFRTVAVFSEADASALHVESADEAVCIGPPAVGESYLVAEKILDAAKATGANAIHPGYGFLSENADFAEACENAGIVFIGPRPDAINLMGSKRLSKIAMLEAAVPCIPGYQGAEQEEEILFAKALEIGFPLMVKASAGGGGRGMRLVHEEGELAEQIRTARSEAEGAFGNGELILEKAVIEPRHIEIQVFADEHGNAVYLGERDCSIQRRHQKVVEEAPSPFVDPDMRMRMGEAAVNAAKACNYRGAGTVEFLVDKDKNFYFLEMNTRLQVEHPVTELITGQDLVAWQLNVAAGKSLPLTQDEITLTGHAVEVRLYAEDPRKNFMPQTGDIMAWDYPLRDGIRVDHGIRAGQCVSPFYDPMIAKVIAYGNDREEACRKLASAIQDSVLLGINNNKLFLQNVLRHEVFIAGEATTAFIEQHFQNDISLDQKEPLPVTLATAGLLHFWDPLQQTRSWISSAGSRCNYRLQSQDVVTDVQLEVQGNDYQVTVGTEVFTFQFHGAEEYSAALSIGGVRRNVHFAKCRNSVYLDDGCGHFQIDNVTQEPAVAGDTAGSGEIKAPMDGAIVDIIVAEGDEVKAGQTLIILEAMKMEHPLKAARDGVVQSIGVNVGQQVRTKQVMISLVDQEES